MKNIFFPVSYFFVTSICAYGQLPKSDIWMTNITLNGGKMTVTKPVSISGKNAYNDEPVFSPDGKNILFTSYSDSLEHTEIYKYQVKTKTAALFTASAESKRTPAIMPDGKNVSFIVAENGTHQRLWKMPLNGGTAEPILKDRDSIGNYCWMSADSVALQVLTSPPSLLGVSISTGVAKLIAQNVGGCIRRMPANLPTPGKWEDVWIFAERSKENTWTMKSFIYGKKSKLIVMPLCPDCNLMAGSENFALIRKGIFSASGSKIFILDNGSNEGWTEVVDLAKYGIKNIKYITFSTDEKKLLIVNTQ